MLKLNRVRATCVSRSLTQVSIFPSSPKRIKYHPLTSFVSQVKQEYYGPGSRLSSRSYSTHQRDEETSILIRPSRTESSRSYPWSNLRRPLAFTILFTATSFSVAYYLDNGTGLRDSATHRVDPDLKLKVIGGLVVVNFLFFGALRVSESSKLAMRGLRTFLSRYALLDARVVHRYPATVLTHGFAHSEIWHIALNMMGLYSFGSSIYDLLGTNQFLAVYGSAICWSGLAQLTVQFYRARRGAMPFPSLGASGGIYTLLGLVAWYAPNSSVYIIFLPFIPIQLGYAFAGMMTVDAIGLVSGWSTFGHAAHFTGGSLAILYGAAQIPEQWLSKRRETMRKYLNRWGR